MPNLKTFHADLISHTLKFEPIYFKNYLNPLFLLIPISIFHTILLSRSGFIFTHFSFLVWICAKLTTHTAYLVGIMRVQTVPYTVMNVLPLCHDGSNVTKHPQSDCSRNRIVAVNAGMIVEINKRWRIRNTTFCAELWEMFSTWTIWNI